MSEKLSVAVLTALAEGADTSNEIAGMLGRQVGSISATLCELEQSGLVRKTGRWRHCTEGRRNKSYCWELTAYIKEADDGNLR